MTTKKLARFLAAVIFGSVFGIAMGYSVRELMNPQSRLPGNDGSAETTDQTPPPGEDRQVLLSGDAVTTENSVAMQYAAALQNGDVDRVIGMTRWMVDRLAYVRSQTGSQEAVAAGRESLSEKLNERSIEGNRLTEEGIEDQYLFAPGVLLEALVVDSGREDLDSPVAKRTWIRAVFPSRRTAPRDAEDVPVRAITVGVNVSRDGYVLKANVIGNLELDMDSISYAWTATGGT